MDALSRDFHRSRKELDAVLDRLEDVLTHGRDPLTYGPLENQADVATVQQFVSAYWSFLDHRQQIHYQGRLAHLQALAKRN